MEKLVLKLDKNSLLNVVEDVKKQEDDVVRLEIALPVSVKLTKAQKTALEKLAIFEIVE